jgi:glycosyltransferase involved in cell wall biosynthesis
MLPRFFVPPPGSAEHRDIIEETNQDVVRGLVERISFLIENPEFRRRLGRAGRHTVEEGKFSIRQRNSKLKRVLDDATGAANAKEHGTA